MIVEFDPVFNEKGPLRTMKGDPMKIHIKPGVKTSKKFEIISTNSSADETGTSGSTRSGSDWYQGSGSFSRRSATSRKYAQDEQKTTAGPLEF